MLGLCVNSPGPVVRHRPLENAGVTAICAARVPSLSARRPPRRRQPLPDNSQRRRGAPSTRLGLVRSLHQDPARDSSNLGAAGGRGVGAVGGFKRTWRTSVWNGPRSVPGRLVLPSAATVQLVEEGGEGGGGGAGAAKGEKL